MPEYDTRSAVPVCGGERVQGIVCRTENKAFIVFDGDFLKKEILGQELLLSTIFIEIDPATIEPVSVKPEKHGNDYLCPNCNRVFWQPKHIPNDQLGEYCDMCGQRIDWS